MPSIRIKNQNQETDGNWQREEVDQYGKKDNQLEDEISQECYQKMKHKLRKNIIKCFNLRIIIMERQDVYQPIGCSS
jgi:hypothetical protein